MSDRLARFTIRTSRITAAACFAIALATQTAGAQEIKIAKTEAQIDALDPGIRLFVREKMQEGNTQFTNENVVLFLHGATAPSTCDFDLGYKDYSWADWMVKRGRTGGKKSTGDALVSGAARHRSDGEPYQADPGRAESQPDRLVVGPGYYASLHSENVHKLVLYAPLYNFNDHTNLGPGSALQNKRKPYEFNFALGAYRFASEAANTGRWNGEIPLENKDEYRDAAVPAAFWSECMATDPSSNMRNPPSLRAPNGVLEDSFYQATGRPLWNASSIYAPTLLIAGAYDTWSYPEDREGLMRDLVHAPAKRSVLIPDATHFVLFEKNRFQFFEEVLKFLKQ
jgi:hypothetical protein